MKFGIISLCLVLGTFEIQASPDDESSSHHPSIRIPSDPDLMGISYTAQNPVILETWKNLSPWTHQTLRNFQSGNRQGILYVHGLEDGFGADVAFREIWNLENPKDQRHHQGHHNFHEVFTPKEIVEGYINKILAHRVMIAGSVLSFHENPIYTNARTYSPVGFVLDVPAPCIMAGAYEDIESRVEYRWKGDDKIYSIDTFDPPRDFGEEAYPVEAWDPYLSWWSPRNLKSLDEVVRFPLLQNHLFNEDKLTRPEMNEVCALSCAQRDGIFYRPSVVGVFIQEDFNPAIPCNEIAKRIWNLKDALKAYAREKGLPVISISASDQESRHIDEFQAMQEEKAQVGPDFRLSSDQLQGYGLKP